MISYSYAELLEGKPSNAPQFLTEKDQMEILIKNDAILESTLYDFFNLMKMIKKERRMVLG